MFHEPQDEIKGFGTSSNLDDGHMDKFTKPPKARKIGGFYAMGLSADVIKGITKRGYRIPTPIQRKSIPLILEGRDVVAMAKTGSGKTACFLIPLFEKLKQREATASARALILSPTRELAIQTFKFIKEIGKFFNLKAVLVLGGDSMDAQFSAIHTYPDIIVATPGRFLHLCVEMDFKLNCIQYVVFDEADRLFEMGFGEQLNETLNRLPTSKQMVMFSATLPKLLVDFAKAGLSDPVLLRLDVETKLPEGLDLKFVYCRPEERYSVLITLLKYIIPDDAQTVVFTGTQHHVELLSYLLTEADISNTLIYSSMDPTARKINTSKFQLKQVSVLVVTDIAARGIDIPNLDYVINVNFPGKPKLFIHRVGRCARAGRKGTAYSIFSTDDEAHLLDLHLFLNRPFKLNDRSKLGIVPQDILEEEHSMVMEWLSNQHIAGVYRSSTNAYKKYIRTRPVASVDSNKRVKNINFGGLKSLEDFFQHKYNRSNKHTTIKEEYKFDLKEELISKMQNYRPSGTVFEINSQHQSAQFKVMQNKRAAHGTIIETFKKKINEHDEEIENNFNSENTHLQESTETDILGTFDKIVNSRKRPTSESLYNKKQKKKKTTPKKDNHYIPYNSADKYTEDGLAINSFEQQAKNAEFNISDNVKPIDFKPGMKKWDRIKKKMVSVQDPRIGKIRTESGIWIPATYKTGRYDNWKEKTKIEEQVQREFGEDDSTSNKNSNEYTRWGRNIAKQQQKKRVRGADKELRNTDQIVKERLRLEFIKKKEITNRIAKSANRKKHLKKMKQKSKKK